MSNSEMLIPIKVLKSNNSAVEIYKQFEDKINHANFSEIPTIDKLKKTLQKENIKTLNEIIQRKNESNNWSIELNMETQNKHIIWANSISNAKLECIFIGTENDSIQNKMKLAEIISSQFGQLLYYSMTGEGFIIEHNEAADIIEKKYLEEFKSSREWKQTLKDEIE